VSKIEKARVYSLEEIGRCRHAASEMEIKINEERRTQLKNKTNRSFTFLKLSLVWTVRLA
jgi:hypothetical protein